MAQGPWVIQSKHNMRWRISKREDGLKRRRENGVQRRGEAGAGYCGGVCAERVGEERARSEKKHTGKVAVIDSQLRRCTHRTTTPPRNDRTSNDASSSNRRESEGGERVIHTHTDAAMMASTHDVFDAHY